MKAQLRRKKFNRVKGVDKMDREREVADCIKTPLQKKGEVIYLGEINREEGKEKLAARILDKYSNGFPQNKERVRMFAELVLNEVPQSGGRIPESTLEDFFWHINRNPEMN